MSEYKEPSHIAVMNALESFLKEPSGDEPAIQFTLMRDENGKLTLSTFYPTGDGSLPIEAEPPTGDVEVGETLRMIGRRIVRLDPSRAGSV